MTRRLLFAQHFLDFGERFAFGFRNDVKREQCADDADYGEDQEADGRADGFAQRWVGEGDDKCKGPVECS